MWLTVLNAVDISNSTRMLTSLMPRKRIPLQTEKMAASVEWYVQYAGWEWSATVDLIRQSYIHSTFNKLWNTSECWKLVCKTWCHWSQASVSSAAVWRWLICASVAKQPVERIISIRSVLDPASCVARVRSRSLAASSTEAGLSSVMDPHKKR